MSYYKYVHGDYLRWPTTVNQNVMNEIKLASMDVELIRNFEKIIFYTIKFLVKEAFHTTINFQKLC